LGSLSQKGSWERRGENKTREKRHFIEKRAKAVWGTRHFKVAKDQGALEREVSERRQALELGVQ